MNSGDRHDIVGLAGYGCLSVLLLSGLGGGLGLIVMGIGAYLRAGAIDVEDTVEAHRLLDGLEGAVVLCGAGTLALLVGLVALVVLLKELGDDSRRASRGAAPRE